MADKEIEQIVRMISNFEIKGNVETVLPFGSGHINDTYKVINGNAECPDYLLQRINHEIFRDVPGLTNNIVYVTEHLKQKLIQVSGPDSEKQVLTPIPSVNGQYFYRDEDGRYWRLYLFLKETLSYDVVTTATQAYEGGKAFGNFQTLLADLDLTQLTETIPDFHNIRVRLKQLEQALQQDKENRAVHIAGELKFIGDRGHDMAEIERLGEMGKIPARITHNDTKFNNILFNKHGKGQCVIDLDTVMAGYTAFDFGDAVRTIINPAAEDEPDLGKIILNIPLFKAFTRGFLETTAHQLSEEEAYSLAKGVLLLPFIMGVRFITDYLNGDIYYKIKFSSHNLQRARAQFHLVKQLEQQYQEIYTIIWQTWQRARAFNGEAISTPSLFPTPTHRNS